jgi:hypothetical protein
MRLVMRYVLPALPVSGPRDNRARRREAARQAQRQATRGGKTQRQDAAGCCGGSASAKALCSMSDRHSLESAMLTKDLINKLNNKLQN